MMSFAVRDNDLHSLHAALNVGQHASEEGRPNMKNLIWHFDWVCAWTKSGSRWCQGAFWSVRFANDFEHAQNKVDNNNVSLERATPIRSRECGPHSSE